VLCSPHGSNTARCKTPNSLRGERYPSRTRKPRCTQSVTQWPSSRLAMCCPCVTRVPVDTRLVTGSRETLRPASVVIVRTPRSTTSPAKLITPATGAITRGLSAAKSKPRWPGPHGVGGATKSSRIICGPDTGHTQVAGGAGGNRRLRVKSRVVRRVTWGTLPVSGTPWRPGCKAWDATQPVSAGDKR
jgi:hypothetical protein